MVEFIESNRPWADNISLYSRIPNLNQANVYKERKYSINGGVNRHKQKTFLFIQEFLILNLANVYEAPGEKNTLGNASKWLSPKCEPNMHHQSWWHGLGGFEKKTKDINEKKCISIPPIPTGDNDILLTWDSLFSLLLSWVSASRERIVIT